MSEKPTLDHVEIEKLIMRGKMARAEHMRRYGAATGMWVGSKLRAHHVVAVVAILIISFGVGIFFFPAPTADAVPTFNWPLP